MSQNLNIAQIGHPVLRKKNKNCSYRLYKEKKISKFNRQSHFNDENS